MPSDTQNQNPTETSLPPSLQEPTADAPIPTTDSIPAEVPSGAPESSPNDFSAKSDNMPPSNSTHTEAENEPKTEEKKKKKKEGARLVRESSKPSLARELLITARNAIQFRKRKKIDHVMSL